MKLKLLLLPLLALSLLTSCDRQKPTTIKIGCLAPLTGEGATYGRATKDGVDFAVAELNQANFLSQPIEVVYEDDRIDAKTGVNALQKLVEIQRVPVVIGPFGSSVVLACAPIANQKQCVIISASATADSIADAGDFVFRITPPNSKQGADDAEFSSKTLGAKSAAIIFQNNDYGITLRDAFQKKFTSLGGAVTASESIEGGASDVRAQLSKIKAANPDVVFFPVHHKEGALVLKQARELGLTAKFISADGAMTPELIEIAGPAAEGAYFSTLALGYGLADKEITAFEEAFKKAHGGTAPDVYTSYYYEVTKIIAQAIKHAGPDGTKIRDYLYGLKDANAYRGITGVTSFDAKGEVDKPFYIYTVTNGKYERAGH